MAAARCPSCNSQYSDQDALCPVCFVNLVPVDEATPVTLEPGDPASAKPAPTDACTPSTGEKPDQDETLCPHCGYRCAAGDQECGRCFSPLSPPLAPLLTPSRPIIRLQWPWGESELIEDLAIGRDPVFSPLAAQLASYDNLSRRHAWLRPLLEGLEIEDLQSTNGTYWDGIIIPSGSKRQVNRNGLLRFAADLQVHVMIKCE